MNDPQPSLPPPGGQLLIYQDGALRLQVRLDGQTVWLTQAAMAELYQTTPQNITLHLQGIYEDAELVESATCKELLQVRREGARQVQRSLKHYNLEAILAVGYRVRSPRGTLFRQWATARLSELLVKGFTLDDERIKADRHARRRLLRPGRKTHHRAAPRRPQANTQENETRRARKPGVSPWRFTPAPQNQLAKNHALLTPPTKSDTVQGYKIRAQPVGLENPIQHPAANIPRPSSPFVIPSSSFPPASSLKPPALLSKPDK